MGRSRKYLDDYSTALRQLELSHVAITTLEGVNTAEARAAIRSLTRGQHSLLKKMDSAAAKLGAPYPAAKEQAA